MASVGAGEGPLLLGLELEVELLEHPLAKLAGHGPRIEPGGDRLAQPDQHRCQIKVGLQRIGDLGVPFLERLARLFGRAPEVRDHRPREPGAARAERRGGAPGTAGPPSRDSIAVSRHAGSSYPAPPAGIMRGLLCQWCMIMRSG